MWILILTLVVPGSGAGQAISSVSGFTSESACMEAAKTWKDKVLETGNFRAPVAVCAKA